MRGISDRRWLARAACLSLTLLCAGCMKGDAAPSTVSGTASWSDGLALPPGAILEVTLEDVSRADAPAEILGRTLIESPGNAPIEFSIPYDADRIDPAHRYSVRARVTLGEKLLHATDTSYPVLEASQSSHVDLQLRQVAPAG